MGSEMCIRDSTGSRRSRVCPHHHIDRTEFFVCSRNGTCDLFFAVSVLYIRFDRIRKRQSLDNGIDRAGRCDAVRHIHLSRGAYRNERRRNPARALGNSPSKPQTQDRMKKTPDNGAVVVKQLTATVVLHCCGCSCILSCYMIIWGRQDIQIGSCRGESIERRCISNSLRNNSLLGKYFKLSLIHI